MNRFFKFVWIACFLPHAATSAEPVVLDPGWHHLRNAEPREWSHFPEKADRNRLTLEFDLENPDAIRLLTLRQEETKQAWTVTLNGEKIGTLLRDHNRLEHGIEIKAGLLKGEGNQLEIATTSEKPDDIFVGDIRLHDGIFELAEKEKADALAKNRGFRRAVPPQNVTVKLSCVDADSGKALPCRFTIVDAETKALAFVGAESDDQLAVREGVVYSIDGQAKIRLSQGRKYEIYAGRGFEYSLAKQPLFLENGDDVTLTFKIRREVETPGLVACDTHLHTFEFDRHGDCTMTERAISAAGEGVELPISTGHDKHVAMPTSSWFTPVLGCEVTTHLGHFNSFPIEPGASPAAHKLRPWPQIFQNIFATPGVKICIINHPRDVHRNYTPLGPENFNAETGTFLKGKKLRANGIEIINSGATQTDPMQLVGDWFALLKSGHKIAAVGSSDSHTVNFAIPGQGRTYVEAPDSDPAKIDIDTAVQSFLDGRTWVSFGLLTRLDLENDEAKIQVLGPSWTTAGTVEIFRNGESVKKIDIAEAEGKLGGVKFLRAFSLADLGAEPGDFLCAVARGPGLGPEAPWWPMMPPYQPDSPELKTYVFGMSPAVWIAED